MKNREIPSGPRVMSGPEMDPNIEHSKEVTGVTEKDLRAILPKVDETTLMLQRNAKDDRDPESPDYGALAPEAAKATRAAAKEHVTSLFNGLPADEREQLEILVLASDASLVAPEGEEFNSEHRRAIETASQIIEGAKEAMAECGVSEEQLLNLSEFEGEASAEGPVEFTDLEPLQILSQSPEFVQHLKDTYGTGKEFWVAYEQDKEKIKRVELGAEGVSQIAERMRSFLKLIAQGGMERHAQHPGKRLVIWAVSHYDAISPFVKEKILERSATEYLPINAGGGVTIEIDKKGSAKTELSGKQFTVRL